MRMSNMSTISGWEIHSINFICRLLGHKNMFQFFFLFYKTRGNYTIIKNPAVLHM